MTEALRFTIPGPPGHWRRARLDTRAGYPRQFTDRKTRAWEDTVREAALAKCPSPIAIQVPCALTVEFRLAMPSSKSGMKAWMNKRGMTGEPPILWPHDGTPDLDNMVKAIKDGMTKARIWEDDRLVARLTAAKWWCRQGDERTDVEVSELEEMAQ